VIGCKCDACLSPDPTDKRYRSSVYLEVGPTKILIDIGPDFRNQFLENNLEDVDAVLLTHEHNDHVIGMDDIRAINFIQKKSIPIYAKQNVISQLTQRFAYAFGNNKYPGTPLIHLIPIGEFPFIINEVEIIPVHLLHGRLDILGYRVGDFAYLTDASSIPESEYPKLNQLKILIINALRKEPHHRALHDIFFEVIAFFW